MFVVFANWIVMLLLCATCDDVVIPSCLQTALEGGGVWRNQEIIKTTIPPFVDSLLFQTFQSVE